MADQSKFEDGLRRLEDGQDKIAEAMRAIEKDLHGVEKTISEYNGAISSARWLAGLCGGAGIATVIALIVNFGEVRSGVAVHTEKIAGLESRLGDRLGAADTKFVDRIAALETRFGERLSAVDMRAAEKIGACEKQLGFQVAVLEKTAATQREGMDRLERKLDDLSRQRTGMIPTTSRGGLKEFAHANLHAISGKIEEVGKDTVTLRSGASVTLDMPKTAVCFIGDREVEHWKDLAGWKGSQATAYVSAKNPRDIVLMEVETPPPAPDAGIVPRPTQPQRIRAISPPVPEAERK